MPILAQTNNQMFNLQKSIGWIAANLFGSISKTLFTASPIAAIVGAYFTKHMETIQLLLLLSATLLASILVNRLILQKWLERIESEANTDMKRIHHDMNQLHLARHVDTTVMLSYIQWMVKSGPNIALHSPLEMDAQVRSIAWERLQRTPSGFTYDDMKKLLDAQFPPQ